MNQIEDCLDQLNFAQVDRETVMGELNAVPTSLSLLTADPPAVLFQFRVNEAGTQTQPLFELLEGVPEDKVSLTIEEGTVWLSLYDVSSLSGSAIKQIAQQMAAVIQSNDLALTDGCLRCGDTQQAALMYVEGCPTRICEQCLQDAAAERQDVASELNRPTLGATLALPGAAIYVAAAWAIFWFCTDLFLESLDDQVLHLNIITLPIVLVALFAIVWAIGWWSGKTLRRSFTVQKAPRSMAVLFIVAATIAGELLFVALCVLRIAGQFDLKLAAGLLIPFVATYTQGWIVNKLLFMGGIAFFCAFSASQKQYVKMDL